MKTLTQKQTIVTAMLAALFVSASIGGGIYAAPDLSGTYQGDDGAIYYLQQSGGTLWWAGMSLDAGVPADNVWHRGLRFCNVFRGTIYTNTTIVGEWSDVSRGLRLNSGMLTLTIGSGDVPQLTKLTGAFFATVWTRTNALDDTKFNGTPLDIVNRFDAVHKNNADEGIFSNHGSTIHENLKPYRDATVVYGHIITGTGNLIDGFNNQAPHVNYGSYFGSPVPDYYLNFGLRDRDFHSFTCFGQQDSDGDFDMRLKIDLSNLETDIYTTGWGDRDTGAEVFIYKFLDPGTHLLLGLTNYEAYLGVEAIMYGKAGTCHDPSDSTYGRASLLPGWADLDGNSVLVNGRPINGLLLKPQPCDTCDACKFIQPCPYVDPSGDHLKNGIQIGSHRLVADTYVRITGTLVLDCGHTSASDDLWLDHECNDDIQNADEVRASQDQEIHPIYSIDIIEHPFRPEDRDMPRTNHNLTGAWGGHDGSTYYVRQIGNTIWWLGLMRDRQPIQRGTHSPIIGANQLALAFAADDPPCTSAPSQCWAFATVFKGSISEYPGGAIIQGDWAGVRQSASLGSSGGPMTFYVYNNRKIIVPGTSPSVFPNQLEKLYEPEDTTPPAITIAQPTATNYSHSDTITLDYGVTDDAGSGLQSVTPKMDDKLTLDDGTNLLSGQMIHLLTQMKVGEHTFSIEAEDKAGNTSSNSVTFAIVVTAASVQEDVNQFVATRQITQNDGRSLLSKLASAAKARAKGDCANAATIYTSFISEVQALSGKKIDPPVATILIDDAQYLIAHCP